jgi:hypothetical protein
MIRDSSFHRWRYSEGLVDSAEVVMKKVERDGVAVIFQLL